MMEIVFSILGGGILTWIFTVIFEILQKPELKISIVDPVDIDYSKLPQKRPANLARFLRLSLENKKPSKFVFWISRKPAFQCHGYISFYHLDTQEVFHRRKMEYRWPSTPEPYIKTVKKPGSVLDNEYIMVPDMASIFPYLRRDIPSGESEEIDVVARFDNEDDCYGWSNDSYAEGWKLDKWKLPKGRYIIKIDLIASGYRLSEVFRIVNDMGMNDFRLEKAKKEDKAVLVSN